MYFYYFCIDCTANSMAALRNELRRQHQLCITSKQGCNFTTKDDRYKELVYNSMAWHGRPWFSQPPHLYVSQSSRFFLSPWQSSRKHFHAEISNDQFRSITLYDATVKKTPPCVFPSFGLKIGFADVPEDHRSRIVTGQAVRVRLRGTVKCV